MATKETHYTNTASVRRFVATELPFWSPNAWRDMAGEAARLASRYEIDVRAFPGSDLATVAARKARACRASEKVLLRAAKAAERAETKAAKERAAADEARRIAYENDPATIASKAAAHEWVKNHAR